MFSTKVSVDNVLVLIYVFLNSQLIIRTGSEMSARGDVSAGSELGRCGDPEAGLHRVRGPRQGGQSGHREDRGRAQAWPGNQSTQLSVVT